MLNGLNAYKISFRQCHFDKAIMANAMFEDCVFSNCTGNPIGLCAARGVNTTLPPHWAKLIKGRDTYWQTLGDRSDIMVIPSLTFNSVAFSPDGQRLLTGS